ncbi:hypothetical protein J7K86_00600 [bacterium]|nr:hypothetical protein [bacterium]
MVNLLPEEMQGKEKKQKEVKENIPIKIKISEERKQKDFELEENKETKTKKMEINAKKILPKKKFEPSGLEVSLMKEKGPVPKRLIKEKILTLFVYLLIFILIILSIRFYSNWRYKTLKTEINNYQKKISSLDKEIKIYLPIENRVISLEKKVKRIDNILNQHIYWTKFFSLLEYYTIPDIYYGDFSADTSGKITLLATAKNLSAIAHQWLAFSSAKNFVKSVDISDITFNKTGGINFKIKLILIPGVFYK